MVFYEHPLNNKIRTWLRFSHLYARLMGVMTHSITDWDYFAFKALFELLEMTEMNDIRGDLLMELDRFHQFLQTLANNPDINKEEWQRLVEKTHRASMDLRASQARPAHVLCSNPWVANVRMRMNAAGGCNDFDVPSFHWWRHQEVSRQKNDMQQFSQLFAPYAQAVANLLDNIRNTAEEEQYTMINGAVTLSLTNTRPVVLIRLALPAESSYFPEISASRHIVNIRLLAFGEGNWETRKVSDNGQIAIYQCAMPSFFG